jgi:hypothetical protein
MTAKMLAAAALAAVTLTACGSSHKPSGTTASSSQSQGLELANCMRSHGVPSFPDPSAGGGGVNLAGTGINPQSPAFKAAGQTCRGLTPGGSGAPQATESQFLAALRFAKCMRTHGFPDFPDPTRTDSPAPILIVGSGLFFHVSASFDPTTPAVKHAVAACGQR